MIVLLRSDIRKGLLKFDLLLILTNIKQNSISWKHVQVLRNVEISKDSRISCYRFLHHVTNI